MFPASFIIRSTVARFCAFDDIAGGRGGTRDRASRTPEKQAQQEPSREHKSKGGARASAEGCTRTPRVDSPGLSAEPNYTTNLMNERASKDSGPYMSVYKPRSMPCGGFCARSKRVAISLALYRINSPPDGERKTRALSASRKRSRHLLRRITDRGRFYPGVDEPIREAARKPVRASRGYEAGKLDRSIYSLVRFTLSFDSTCSGCYLSTTCAKKTCHSRRDASASKPRATCIPH